MIDDPNAYTTTRRCQKCRDPHWLAELDINLLCANCANDIRDDNDARRQAEHATQEARTLERLAARGLTK